MKNTSSDFEENVKRLRSALSEKADELIDRALSSLERNWLDNRAYEAIGNEKLLAEAVRILDARYGGQLQYKVDGLRQHLIVMRAIHDKLYAILDLGGVDIDVLLTGYLDQWPQMEVAIGCSFNDAIKDKLNKARDIPDTYERLHNFFSAYFEYLQNQGHSSFVDTVGPLVQLALGGYQEEHTWTTHALFSEQDGGAVYGLKLDATPGGTGAIKFLSVIDYELDKAAKSAMECVNRIWPQTKLWNFTLDIGRDDISFAGSSIGLALTLGIFALTEKMDIDAYTAFTGHVEWATGDIRRIEQLSTKLEAAKEMGFRRVLIPQANSDEVSEISGVTIIPVSSVLQAKQFLQTRNYGHARTPLETIALAKIRTVELELNINGIHLVECEQLQSSGKHLVFSNFHERIPVDIYFGQKGLRLVVGGKDSDLKGMVASVCNKIFGVRPTSERTGKEERIFKKYDVVGPVDRKKVKDYVLGLHNSIHEPQQDCDYRAKIVEGGQTVFVRQFSKGTLTIDGPSPLADEIDGFIRAILGASDLPTATDGKKKRLDAQIGAVKSVELGDQWIGTDESGKGDYFGPLVGAAVLTDRRTAKVLEEIGVKDSKQLSDKRALELADRIRQVCGKRAQVITISPQKYNELYEEFQREKKNLNTLLAWAHTRALEEILMLFPQKHITVLVDKFADEHYIQSKLLEKGRQTDINLVQLPKAEANIAVAAASVLARAQFLQWLDRLSAQYKIDFPKGASDPRIVEIGKQIVARGGKGELAKVAKLHFKTTEKILASN